MTSGLNLARASCAAESREGSMPSSARKRRQAASREIGFAPAAVKSAAVADRASGEKAVIRLYFEIRCIPIGTNSVGSDNDRAGKRSHGNDHSGPSESLSLPGSQGTFLMWYDRLSRST